MLSINTFQRDLTDSNPLIRAMALRVLSGIKVPMIVTVVTLAIKQCAADISPYVRKAAALAIPKMHRCVHTLVRPWPRCSTDGRLDPSQQPTLITIISTLLRDRSPLSIGSAVIAFESVCPTRLDLLHQQYRRLCRVVVEVDEWGQVDLLNLLLRYARTMLQRPILTCEGESHKEDLDGDLQLLLSSAEPLFHSRNPAVRHDSLFEDDTVERAEIGRPCRRPCVLLRRLSVVVEQDRQPSPPNLAFFEGHRARRPFLSPRRGP